MLRTSTNVSTIMSAKTITVDVKRFVLTTKGDTSANALMVINFDLMVFLAKTSMSARKRWMVVNKHVRT